MLDVLEEFGHLRLIPPEPGAEPTDWRKPAGVWRETMASGRSHPVAAAYARLGRAWREGDAAAFNATVADLHRELAPGREGVLLRAAVEARLNSAQPFLTGMVLFVGAFLAGVLSWLRWPATLGRIGLGVVGLFALLGLWQIGRAHV